MTKGIGIDICEVHRFERLQENTAFIERVFSKNEIKYCSNKRRSAEYFAARFAAKEAFSKALGTGIRNGLVLKDIEIIKNETGKPELLLHNNAKTLIEERGIDQNCIMLSISHEKSVAVAVVIIN